MELKKRRGNIWMVSSASLLLLAASSVFYWKLVRLGYAVPIPYILDVFCLNNCSADDLNTLHTKLPPDNSLNSDNIIESRSNCTLGCVSLENQDVEELYRFVQQRTAVEIVK